MDGQPTKGKGDIQGLGREERSEVNLLGASSVARELIEMAE